MKTKENLTAKEELDLQVYHHKVIWVARLGFAFGMVLGLGFPVYAWLTLPNPAGWWAKLIVGYLLVGAVLAWLTAIGGIGVLDRRKWGLRLMKIGMLGLALLMVPEVFIGVIRLIENDVIRPDYLRLALQSLFAFTVMLGSFWGLNLLVRKKENYFR